MAVPHIPCLRLGEPYVSLNKIEVTDYRDGATKATVSQVNAGVVRRDLQRIDEGREALRRFSTTELIEIGAKAGEIFLNGEVEIGVEGEIQSPRQYVETLSSTSGLPHVMVRRNMLRRTITCGRPLVEERVSTYCLGDCISPSTPISTSPLRKISPAFAPISISSVVEKRRKASRPSSMRCRSRRTTPAFT